MNMNSMNKLKTWVTVALSCVFIYSHVIYKYQSRPTNNTTVSDEYQICLKHRRQQQNHDMLRADPTKTSMHTPLLVFFTTWNDNKDLDPVNNITLHNWSRLKPWVLPVFFSTTGKQDGYILEQGWKILRVSKTSPGGIPILKYMFMDVVCKFEASFYAYSNGDILYDNSIVDTLKMFTLSVDSRKPVFVTGIRTNVPNVTATEMSTLSLKFIAKRGERFREWAQDYFITDANYPWEHIPEVVVGKVGYDNWLVLNARRLDCLVVDASETLLAVHQTTASGNFAGSQSSNPNYNLDLLKREFMYVPYDEGSTICASYVTMRKDPSKDIRMVERSMLPLSCRNNLPFLFMSGAILLGLYAARSVYNRRS